jgi:hypothetical protein
MVLGIVLLGYAEVRSWKLVGQEPARRCSEVEQTLRIFLVFAELYLAHDFP